MKNGKKIRVYVAGPITKGNQFLNCVRAIQAGNELFKMGYVPFIPHLSYWWNEVAGPHSHEAWLAYDLQWVALCHALLRLKGDSMGADVEVAFAKKHRIPVYTSIRALKKGKPICKK